MGNERAARRIAWYRSPIDRRILGTLNQPSDLKGLLQTLGYLGLLTLTGTAAWYTVGRYPWPVTVAMVFLHGTFYAFLINGFHELCHRSVFRSRFLNAFFLRIFSFIGWYDQVGFWASHAEHHKYTLHPPDDLEVVLPQTLTLGGFLKYTIVNPRGVYDTLKRAIRLSLGRVEGDWENALFPSSDPKERRRLFNWSRVLLVGHALLVGISIWRGQWIVPILITLGPFYGGWLQYLCNNTQHAGLSDNVPDFRLCCRSIVLNPFLRFLYWHMNFHTEHHMYAAVPCYNLGKLREAIKHDLPTPSNGLYAAWREIAAIQKKQEQDPTYQHAFELPTESDPVDTRA